MSAFLESSAMTVIIALAVPVLWGVLSAWVFDKLRARQERRRSSGQRESGT